MNSKKNNYNQQKIQRHLNYIDQKADEYLKELDENDHKEQGERKLKVKECLQIPTPGYQGDKFRYNSHKIIRDVIMPSIIRLISWKIY